MRKVSIVAPIGTSPPVITEFLQYVEKVLDQRVTDVTIITTKEPLVLEGLELVKTAVADRYPKVRVYVIELPFDDVDSEGRSMEFLRIASKILIDQKKYDVDIVHLCVAGGRKEVCIMLSMLAQFHNVNGVYHIVMRDVKAYNEQLERIRHEVKELADAEDKLGYYSEKRGKLEPVMFPATSEYNVIRIPVIPYPTTFLLNMKRILDARKVRLRPADAELIFRLKTLGYMRVTRTGAYITTEGERLSSILEAVVS